MKLKFKITVFTIALVFGAATLVKADEIDRYIETQMRNLHIPGVSLAVVRGGRIVKAKGYGLANIEAKSPAAPDSVYEIGSLTKQFTAAAIMLLVEDGKISLDDPVTKYLAGAPERWNRITVRHLLNHTSGIQNHVAVPDYIDIFKISITSKNFPSRDDLLQEFYKLPSEFEPGATWSYDNTGYYLLGVIVEKASGKDFWQFLDERIFKPLGMRSTRSSDTRLIVSNRAAGYVWANGEFENRPVLPPFVGFSAGSLISTVEDLAKWDAALDTEKVLKKSSLAQMWTPTKTNSGETASFDYGFGWFIENYRGRRDIHHSGGTPGFSSVMHRFVDDKLTVIILTNHADRMIDQMAFEIAGRYVPALNRPEGKTDADPSTTKRLKELMSNLLKGEWKPDDFTVPMQIHLNTATGKSLWQWYAYQGALESFAFSDREDAPDGLSVIRYKTVLGGNPYRFSFRITKDGKIAQIYWW